jgi:hypothetical protein
MRSIVSLSRTTAGLAPHLSAISRAVILLSTFTLAVLLQGIAQQGVQANPARITRAANDSNLTTLRGNVHPLARPEYDQGAAPLSEPMNHLHFVLRRSSAQEASLEGYLASTQARNSPNYRKWLTPEQFGDLFGPSDLDLQKLTGWLRGRGFTVNFVGKGRTTIDFSGSVGHVQDAFHTAIHSYQASGEQFLANTSDPSIPAAFADVVAGITGLNTIQPEPTSASGASGTFDPKTGKLLRLYQTGLRPDLNNSDEDYLFLTASDAATIYNSPNSKYNPNYPGSSPTYDGTGATIGIAGRSAIDPTLITNYRGKFLGDSRAPIITNLDGVGVVARADFEAYLDNEVSGGVAPGATVHFYTSTNVTNAAFQAIEENTIDVLSLSFGECEQDLGSSGNLEFYNNWQQAATQGITVVVSAEDTGSAGCDYFLNSSGDLVTSASGGLAVNGFASTPYNVAVGGTNFYPLTSDFAKYVDTTTQGSSSTYYRTTIGYIPESTWNDSTTNDTTISLNVPWTSASGNQNILSGSGGPSSCSSLNAAGDCVPYPKPPWQTGIGVPSDGVRDLPDLALFSGGLYGKASWVICDNDTNASGVVLDCATDSSGRFSWEGAYGTSAAAPAFAGIIAMVVGKTGQRQGQATEVLYNLFNSAIASLIFKDITIGNNAVPCTMSASNSSDCLANAGGFNFESGFDTNVGYDLATGLGSVNIANLVTNWTSGSLDVANVTATPSATAITIAEPLVFTVDVTPLAGGISSPPAGTVTAADAVYTSPPVPLNNGSATINIPANSLPANLADTFTISYFPTTGSQYAPASAFVTVAITQIGSLVISGTSIAALEAGSSGSSTVTITPSGGFTGGVTLSCSVAGPPGAISLPTCSYSPTGVTIAGTTSGTSTLTVATMSTTTGGSYTVTINAADTATGKVMATSTLALTIGGFVLASTAATVASPGQAETSTITITPTNYSGTVGLGCVIVSQPSGANGVNNPNCMVTPNTATISSSTPTTVTANITTTAPAMAALTRPKTNRWSMAADGAALACILLFGIPARRRGWRSIIGLLVFVSATAGIGCSRSVVIGPNEPPTPGTSPGVYTFAVVGTDTVTATTTASTVFTVTVQ